MHVVSELLCIVTSEAINRAWAVSSSSLQAVCNRFQISRTPLVLVSNDNQIMCYLPQKSFLHFSSSVLLSGVSYAGVRLSPVPLV